MDKTNKCKFCDKTFEKSQSRSAHQKWCNPETRPNLVGDKNPMWGKKGKNQWTDKNWDEVPFSNLGKGKRREFLLKECGYACTICGFSQSRKDGTIILQIDHIDGNNRNNSRENLRVLCPNCHAIHSDKFMHIGQLHTEEAKKKITKKLIHAVVSPRFPKPLKE